MDKIKRIKELVSQLNTYRNLYYNNSESQISDYEYDNLFDELKSLEDETGVIMSNSPTQTVGYEVKSKLEKVKHSHSMLSLDKTKSVDDLRTFAGSNDCVLSLKMDGLKRMKVRKMGEEEFILDDKIDERFSSEVIQSYFNNPKEKKK